MFKSTFNDNSISSGPISFHHFFSNQNQNMVIGYGLFTSTSGSNSLQVTWGHNIVANGWAGIYNPHPSPPLFSLTYNHNCGIISALFQLERSHHWTGKVFYRFACPWLKYFFFLRFYLTFLLQMNQERAGFNIFLLIVILQKFYSHNPSNRLGQS